MADYKYRASVIIPVYNVEEYLETCLMSMVRQTIDHKDLEVLVINDGSKDGSLLIAQRFAKEHDFIHVFSKENEGLSATRNYGIRRAQGRYLFFLDSDDYLTDETVENVCDFFDRVYNEVDLVAYYEINFDGSRALSAHYRFSSILKEEGVYDLYEFPYITQTRINVAVKNLGEKNHLFHHDRYFRQEDQEYNNRVLMDKMKIGYCPGGTYMYNRGNETSIVQTYFYAYYMFERSTKYFEDLFAMFPEPGEVPAYFQAMYLNDLNYKLTQDFLYPYHYEPERFQEAVDRIKALLRRVDVDTIVNHPLMSNFHKHYWLSMKDNAHPAVLVDRLQTVIAFEGKTVYRNGNGIEIMVTNLSAQGRILRFRGFIKSPIFNYVEKPVLLVHENEISFGQKTHTVPYLIRNGYPEETWEKTEEVPTWLSSFSMDNCSTKTNNFYAFDYAADTERVRNFDFSVVVDGIEIRTDYTFQRQTALVPGEGRNEVLRDHIQLRYGNRKFSVRYLNDAQSLAVRTFITRQLGVLNLKQNMPDQMRRVFGSDTLPEGWQESLVQQTLDYYDYCATLRTKVLELKDGHRIWLYCDLHTVRKDNGYYQFIHDFQYDDGIDRYYICGKELEEVEDLFTEEQMKRVVLFGSEMHRQLYLAAELIFTAFYGYTTISPFQDEILEMRYDDLKTFKVIYLQHGVLHASLRRQNSVENYRADRIVISSHFEKENYMKNYHYREEDLICTGMARYDHIDRGVKPERKILYAPSWREYLTAKVTASKWNLQKDRIASSDYYKGINNFINNKELLELLEKEDLRLELKMHPIIAGAKDLFTLPSKRIVMADSEVNVEEYCMFITDFSSFVFDYAWLSRPVLYFVPDYDQFRSGMGHYRDLDLPFDKAFGPMVRKAEDAAAEVIKAAHRRFEAEPVYKDRMDKFYFDFQGDCAENLYQYTCEYLKQF